ncbi:MAG: hypothetical protein QM736_28085 [Vicinamibacterales bacterium]
MLEQFRKAQHAYAPPELQNYAFEDQTFFESTRGPLRIIRKLLQPILKLFFNPNPLIQALNIQSKLNASLAEREAKRDARTLRVRSAPLPGNAQPRNRNDETRHRGQEPEDAESSRSRASSSSTNAARERSRAPWSTSLRRMSVRVDPKTTVATTLVATTTAVTTTDGRTVDARTDRIGKSDRRKDGRSDRSSRVNRRRPLLPLRRTPPSRPRQPRLFPEPPKERSAAPAGEGPGQRSRRRRRRRGAAAAARLLR